MKYPLIIALAACFSAITAEEHLKPIHIDSGVLGLVDGTALIDVRGLLHFINRMNIIAYGEKDHDTGVRHGIFMLNGQQYSLKQLLELNLSEEELDNVLDQVITRFEEISQPYTKQIESSKWVMLDLIKAWSRQRSRANSPLLAWSNIDSSDKNATRRSFKTLEEFDLFHDDLRLFMTDLVCSCKISLSAYHKHAAAHTTHGATQ